MSSTNPWTTSDPILVASPNSREPALAAVGETPHLLWTKDKVIHHAMRHGDTWSAPIRVAAGEQPAVAASLDGRLHCLFTNQFAGNYEIFYVTWDGVRWSLPELVSRTTGTSTQPALAIGPNGVLHAAWADTTPGYTTVYYGYRGIDFWSSIPIPSGRGSAPAIAVTPAGDVYVAWQDRLATTKKYEVFCAVCRGSTWVLPDIVSDTPGNHSLQPRMTVRPQGDCHLVWLEESGGLYGVRLVNGSDGSWSTAADVASVETDCRLPRIAAIRQGLIEVVWAEGQTLYHRVRPSDGDAEWWNAEIVPGTYAGLCDLALAVGRTGLVHLVSCRVESTGVRQLYYAQREALYKYVTTVPVG